MQTPNVDASFRCGVGQDGSQSVSMGDIELCGRHFGVGCGAWNMAKHSSEKKIIHWL